MKIHFRKSSDGDWAALYINGGIAAQGHSLEPEDVLTVLGIAFTSDEIDVDPYDVNAAFPHKLTT